MPCKFCAGSAMLQCFTQSPYFSGSRRCLPLTSLRAGMGLRERALICDEMSEDDGWYDESDEVWDESVRVRTELGLLVDGTECDCGNPVSMVIVGELECANSVSREAGVVGLYTSIGRRWARLRSETRPLPCKRTLYCRNGRASTTNPLRSHSKVSGFWTRTSVPTESSGRVRLLLVASTYLSADLHRALSLSRNVCSHLELTL